MVVKRLKSTDKASIIKAFGEYEKKFPFDALTKEEKREMKQIYRELYPGPIRKFLMRRRTNKLKFGSQKGGQRCAVAVKES